MKKAHILWWLAMSAAILMVTSCNSHCFQDEERKKLLNRGVIQKTITLNGKTSYTILGDDNHVYWYSGYSKELGMHDPDCYNHPKPDTVTSKPILTLIADETYYKSNDEDMFEIVTYNEDIISIFKEMGFTGMEDEDGAIAFPFSSDAYDGIEVIIQEMKKVPKQKII